MTTFLPVDENNHAIPALRLRAGGAQSISATTSSSARNSTAFDANTRVVSVYATGNVYMKFGDNTVTAANTDHYYPAGIYYDFSIGGGKTPHYTNLAVLAADSNCTVYISEKE